MASIPQLIPSRRQNGNSYPLPPTGSAYSLYDVAIGGIGFEYASSAEEPSVRMTAPLERDRIDQAESPGEQTLTGWWIKSQDSFHGGAGQLQLEPAEQTPLSHVRYDLSKNVDVFLPGQVTRLPDTTVLNSATTPVGQMVAVVRANADALVYLTSTGGLRMVTTPLTAPTTVTFTGVSNLLSLATDGSTLYVASSTGVYAVDPGDLSSGVLLATYPTAATTPVALGWVKSRLMVGVNGAVYGLDVTRTGVALSPTNSAFVFQSPSKGWVWRCFADSPRGVMAAGDAAGVQSTITRFTVQSISGAPTLVADGVSASLPIGEKVLSMLCVQGSQLAIGTDRGVRIGQFDPYYGNLTYGPLELTANLPVIPAVQLATRDRFVFAAGRAYDEAGVLTFDLGTQIDQAGRVAWAPGLIGPTKTMTPATAVAVLPLSNRVAMALPDVGLVLEGDGPGVIREAWLRTGRIRYSTTELKLFKLGRIRGVFLNGGVTVTGTTPVVTQALGTYGFVPQDPPEFRLPPQLAEWLQLTFNLDGASTRLTSYGVKALPGTRRQRLIMPVLALYDSETTRSGQRIRDVQTGGARARLAALEELNAAGDEVVFQEFTNDGVVSTIVIVEAVEFHQVGRPTRQQSLGGTVKVQMRAVEA